MSEIVGLEKIEGVLSGELELFIEIAVSQVPDQKGKEVSVAFLSNEEITRLNHDHRGKDAPTDVLSFPFIAEEFEKNDRFLGDIAISADLARQQAAENNLSLEIEIKQLILHGILHLSGYDHATDTGEMDDLELLLRDKLGINQ